ncbi:viroplasmin family protein [Parasegetibacter sp. NRK P23]|uniref:ribonuclease H1 domain-containing protein n=1 Tax=Parasegetibacter sp. NRK P23 TaxID=2942999 RepID=UPI002043D13B|nr:ribonuclease H family protein [Parasegetibacter sp. NRK P23]MCM5530535.1 ribonuclease H family protein [Parasegetibacter sp. NRK P23]
MKKKYYVVWEGRTKGIFDSWNDCKAQIDGFPNAVYKSFPSLELAEQALQNKSDDYIGKKITAQLPNDVLERIGMPLKESIAVDGAWNTATGMVEYQGVHTGSGEKLFQVGPLEDGTNNIAEFLAIVHALALCRKNGTDLPIYSDSRNAIGWVKEKKARTNHTRSAKNKTLFDMIDRAEKWLREHDYPNQILKWETKAWGENPADFGRK